MADKRFDSQVPLALSPILGSAIVHQPAIAPLPDITPVIGSSAGPPPIPPRPYLELSEERLQAQELELESMKSKSYPVFLIMLTYNIEYQTAARHNNSNMEPPINSESSVKSDYETPPIKPFGGKKGFIPKYVSYWDLLPAYPESDDDGFAHVVALPQFIKQRTIDGYASSMQYSVGKGGGAPANSIGVKNEFFKGAYMKRSTRNCNGVMVCEFLDEKHKTPHYHVNEDDIQWKTDADAAHTTEAHSSVYKA